MKNGVKPPLDAQTKYVREAYLAVKRALLRQMNSLEAESYGRRPIPRWDGGQDAYGRTFKSVWPKLAMLLTDHGCDPVMFFRAQIVGATMPAPNAVCNIKAVERYQLHMVESRKLLRVQLFGNINEYRTISAVSQADDPTLKGPQLWRWCLTRPSTLEPLFRLIVALSEPSLQDVASSYWQAGLAQLLTNLEGYENEWKSCVPSTLVKYARDLSYRQSPLKTSL